MLRKDMFLSLVMESFVFMGGESKLYVFFFPPQNKLNDDDYDGDDDHVSMGEKTGEKSVK